jgi:exopolyphosphatase/guanosine-5'-triphosphate,3'-diphosphate pyrophosphatase
VRAVRVRAVPVSGGAARRVAAFDCGTNSLRLLVADVRDGRLTDVVRSMEVVRLGQGVDRTGRIGDEAMARTLAVARRYAATCDELGVAAKRFVATSASRDAENSADFVEGVRAALGISPEVISGQEEAALSFAGATSGVRGDGPFCVVDLGGGSTELVLGERVDGEAVVSQAFSMDVGCVRMTERHLHGDPPTAAEVAAATADVEAALDEASRHVDLARTGRLVGVAGSVTTVTAHALRLDHYDPAAIHGAVLPVPQVLAACEDLLAMPRAGRAALGFMHPGRVDVIGAGALVWSCVVRRVVAAAGLAEVVTSEHDILDGIALRLGA